MYIVSMSVDFDEKSIGGPVYSVCVCVHLRACERIYVDVYVCV